MILAVSVVSRGDGDTHDGVALLRLPDGLLFRVVYRLLTEQGASLTQCTFYVVLKEQLKVLMEGPLEHKGVGGVAVSLAHCHTQF